MVYRTAGSSGAPTQNDANAIPLLSPKKTLAGCIGGVAGAALIGVIYMLCLGVSSSV